MSDFAAIDLVTAHGIMTKLRRSAMGLDEYLSLIHISEPTRPY